MMALTTSQCAELRRRGMEPTTNDWMWVTVPMSEPFAYDRTPYGQLVQHLVRAIFRTGRAHPGRGGRGRLETVYAGGRLTPLRE